MGDHLANFVYFFAVVDPIGTVPVFLSVTAALAPADTRRVAIRAFIASTAILLFFVAVGEIVLAAMDIPLAAFQVAGGIILFLFRAHHDLRRKQAGRGDPARRAAE